MVTYFLRTTTSLELPFCQRKLLSRQTLVCQMLKLDDASYLAKARLTKLFREIIPAGKLSSQIKIPKLSLRIYQQGD